MPSSSNLPTVLSPGDFRRARNPAESVSRPTSRDKASKTPRSHRPDCSAIGVSQKLNPLPVDQLTAANSETLRSNVPPESARELLAHIIPPTTKTDQGTALPLDTPSLASASRTSILTESLDDSKSTYSDRTNAVSASTLLEGSEIRPDLRPRSTSFEHLREEAALEWARYTARAGRATSSQGHSSATEVGRSDGEKDERFGSPSITKAALRAAPSMAGTKSSIFSGGNNSGTGLGRGIRRPSTTSSLTTTPQTMWKLPNCTLVDSTCSEGDRSSKKKLERHRSLRLRTSKSQQFFQGSRQILDVDFMPSRLNGAASSCDAIQTPHSASYLTKKEKMEKVRRSRKLARMLGEEVFIDAPLSATMLGQPDTGHELHSGDQADDEAEPEIREGDPLLSESFNIFTFIADPSSPHPYTSSNVDSGYDQTRAASSFGMRSADGLSGATVGTSSSSSLYASAFWYDSPRLVREALLSPRESEGTDFNSGMSSNQQEEVDLLKGKESVGGSRPTKDDEPSLRGLAATRKDAEPTSLGPAFMQKITSRRASQQLSAEEPHSTSAKSFISISDGSESEARSTLPTSQALRGHRMVSGKQVPSTLCSDSSSSKTLLMGKHSEPLLEASAAKAGEESRVHREKEERRKRAAKLTRWLGTSVPAVLITAQAQETRPRTASEFPYDRKESASILTDARVATEFRPSAHLSQNNTRILASWSMAVRPKSASGPNSAGKASGPQTGIDSACIGGTKGMLKPSGRGAYQHPNRKRLFVSSSEPASPTTESKEEPSMFLHGQFGLVKNESRPGTVSPKIVSHQSRIQESGREPAAEEESSAKRDANAKGDDGSQETGAVGKVSEHAPRESKKSWRESIEKLKLATTQDQAFVARFIAGLGSNPPTPSSSSDSHGSTPSSACSNTSAMKGINSPTRMVGSIPEESEADFPNQEAFVGLGLLVPLHLETTVHGKVSSSDGAKIIARAEEPKKIFADGGKVVSQMVSRPTQSGSHEDVSLKLQATGIAEGDEIVIDSTSAEEKEAIRIMEPGMEVLRTPLTQSNEVDDESELDKAFSSSSQSSLRSTVSPSIRKPANLRERRRCSQSSALSVPQLMDNDTETESDHSSGSPLCASSHDELQSLSSYYSTCEVSIPNLSSNELKNNVMHAGSLRVRRDRDSPARDRPFRKLDVDIDHRSSEGHDDGGDGPYDELAPKVSGAFDFDLELDVETERNGYRPARSGVYSLAPIVHPGDFDGRPVLTEHDERRLRASRARKLGRFFGRELPTGYNFGPVARVPTWSPEPRASFAGTQSADSTQIHATSSHGSTAAKSVEEEKLASDLVIHKSKNGMVGIGHVEAVRRTRERGWTFSSFRKR
ncbi:hypothetical protein IE53DRAFT_277928 [Violaceomyces palustris]|uniref:Uncharacterized protein n=1 Tax=Violaceomyces palustris TaxID=1673888 RepID=A0ACD0P3B5_9BASI|nr:hypothetical protein IE53DRAFT_277928 [Violaceomyces palustris]